MRDLGAEKDTLELELMAANEKLQLHAQRYQDRKTRHRNRLRAARYECAFTGTHPKCCCRPMAILVPHLRIYCTFEQPLSSDFLLQTTTNNCQHYMSFIQTDIIKFPLQK